MVQEWGSICNTHKKYETQTKTMAAFVANDKSTLSHVGFLCKKSNWPNHQKPVLPSLDSPNTSWANLCSGIERKYIYRNIWQNQGQTSFLQVLTSSVYYLFSEKDQKLQQVEVSASFQSQCAATQDCQVARRGAKPCFYCEIPELGPPGGWQRKS